MALETVVIYFLLGGLWVFSELRNYFERKSLLDRIMSISYQDFYVGEIAKKEAQPKTKVELPPSEFII